MTPIAAVFILATSAFAHKGEMHLAPQAKTTGVAEATINRAYVETVKPIFQKSCFDCHSGTVNYPWYYKIPGARQLIDRDIREAKEHLDFSKDFPFGGHGKPLEDLKAIEDAVRDGAMPPFRYWILHREARLSDAERKAILEWVQASKELLRGKQ